MFMLGFSKKIKRKFPTIRVEVRPGIRIKYVATTGERSQKQAGLGGRERYPAQVLRVSSKTCWACVGRT